jgi:hypothetical protein
LFIATAPYDAKHPKALAIYCSDGRFTEAVEDLARHLGHPRLDTITLPGGPGLLNLLSSGFVDLDAMTRATTFLIRGHAIEHVLLVAHDACGHYRHRNPALSPDAIRAVQRADLALAGEALAAAHPKVRLDLFFARSEGGRIGFETVERRAR